MPQQTQLAPPAERRSRAALPWALCVLAGMALQAASAAAQQAEPMSPKIKTFLENCARSRRGAIVQLEQTLRGLRSGQIKAKDPASRIKTVEADLERLRAKKQLIVPTLVFPSSRGDIGLLPGIGGHVKQVLDEDSMLVICYFVDPVAVVRRDRRVLQKVTRPVTYLVRGVSTADVHAGLDLELTQVFEVTDVRRDSTGTRALPIPTVQPFDMEQVESYSRDY